MAWLLPQRGKPLCTLIATREDPAKTVLYLNGSEDCLTLESVLCAYVLAYESILDSVRIFLVSNGSSERCFRSHILSNRSTIVNEAPEEIRAVGMPAVFVEDEHRVVAGLCSSLRYVLLQHGRTEILGFRAACLASCSQVSLWTAFCERDVPSCLLSLNTSKWEHPVPFPEVLLLLEHHLRQPVRTHNDKHLKRVLKVDELRHDFVEGVALTLSDLLLFLCVHLMLKAMQRFSLEETIPEVLKWHKRILNMNENDQLIEFLAMRMESPEEDLAAHFIQSVSLNKILIGELPLPTTCLYSQSKMNSATRMCVKHKDPKQLLEALKGYSVLTEANTKFSMPLNWDSFPEAVRPESGGLPKNRTKRKREQIANVVNAVLSLVDGDKKVIVDFCSGGGHVAIVLAFLLPQCRVMMIENKYESLHKARERVNDLGLKNVWYFQCNLDKFSSHFDIGVSLHACGGATDLVIDKCIKANASLVSVPCCYGGIGHHRSQHFALQKALLSLQDSKAYEQLCHMADRNENAEGSHFMELVDSDRVQFILQHGYHKVILTKLEPQCCTPKNNMIIAHI